MFIIVDIFNVIVLNSHNQKFVFVYNQHGETRTKATNNPSAILIYNHSNQNQFPITESKPYFNRYFHYYFKITLIFAKS